MIVIVIVITHRLFDLHEARSHAERLRDEYVRNAPPTALALHFARVRGHELLAVFFCNSLSMYELEREEHIMTHGQLEEALLVRVILLTRDNFAI